MMNQHRNKKIPGGAVLIGFSLCLCVSVLTTQAQSRGTQTIDQMIEALGGRAFLDVQETHMTGRFFGFTRGELNSADIFVDYIKYPDMERTEFGGPNPKNKVISINRGKEGWKVEPRKDTVEMTPGEVEEFLKTLKTSYDYVLRFVIKERQTTVQNLPAEIIDFKRTDVVELRDPAKNRIRFYIDRNTRLPLKMQVRRNDDSKLREEQYANWHKFQGVATPLFLTRYTDGVKTMEIRAETVVYNSGLADSLFAQPTPAK